MKKSIYNLLIILSLFLTIFSIYKIFQIQSEYTIGKNSYEQLEKYINTNENNENNISIKINNEIKEENLIKADDATIANEENKTKNYPIIDFQSLSNINKDIIAWIYYKDTAINYPIVLTDNNDYYLNHLFDHKTNSSGAIFMDFRNKKDFSDKHSIIYGHNMKNGTMFADLIKLKKQSYYDEHKNATLILEDKAYNLEIVSAYTTDVEDDAWDLDFLDDNQLLDWANKSKAKSIFKSDVQLSPQDKYLTLSTCTYEFSDARFVVLTVLREID